jgi:hypothetical protein
MESSNIWLIVINGIVFLVISYFLFYQSFIKALGKETAKLVTVEDLTKIEESVKQDFRKEIEPIKAQLNKENISHQIEYTFLHQQRGKVLVALYQKLQELHSSMASWTATMQPIMEDADKEELSRAVRVDSAYNECRNYFINHKLFLSKDFSNSINDVLGDYGDLGWDFGYKLMAIRQRGLHPSTYKQFSEEISKISDDVRVKIPPKLVEIETQFRLMLGVTN